MLGLVLLYVGAVLFINGLWLLGKVEDKEIVPINAMVTFLTLCVALHAMFTGAADLSAIKGAALTLLFTMTYLWVAYNRTVTVDGRGLGWFSLFVAITAIPEAFVELRSASGFGPSWLALNWVAWAALWFTYFLLLAQRRPIQRFAGIATLVVGVLTGWLPGCLLLFGRL